MSISMIRDNLDFIPAFDLPSQFSLRWYQPGDEDQWVQIQRQADHYNAITPHLFEQQFGSMEQALRERQCFLIDEKGAALGTATAWFDPEYRGRPFGRLHWVALVPELHGRGLSKPLLSAVCNRMRELGHRRAYLTTKPQRTAAIRLYLKFGFLPEITGPEDAQLWEQLHSLGEI